MAEIAEEDEGGIDFDKKEFMQLKLYNDKIKRPELSMDLEQNFTEKEFNVRTDEAARPAKHNQEFYLKNFGIEL